MEATITKTEEISSALRCRLSGSEPTSIDAELRDRVLILQEIAQKAALDVRPATHRRRFGRSR
jgi:hypothetical protein